MDLQGGLGRLGGLSGKSSGPSGMSGKGRGTHVEVREGSGDPRGGRGRLGYRPWGLGRVGGTSHWSGMGRGTLGNAWDGSGYPRGGRGRVGDIPWGPVWGKVPEVWYETVEPPYDSGWVGGPSVKSGKGWETVGEVWDGSEDHRGCPGLVKVPRGGPGRVRGPSRRSGTGRGTLGGSETGREILGKVVDVFEDGPEGRRRLGYRPWGLGRVGGTSHWSGMGRGTLGNAWDGSGYPRGGRGRVGDIPWGPVWGKVPEVWYETVEPPYDSGWVGGPSVKSGKGWETVGEVWDGSEDHRGCPGLVKVPRGGPGRVRGPSRRSGTGRGTLGGSGTGRETLVEVVDVFEDGPGGPGRVGGPSGRSKGPSERSGTGRGTLGEVMYGSGDPLRGPERVG